MKPQQTRKLYCYVDETGQDTMDNFFIVAIIVADNRRDELQRWLDVVERGSGKKTKCTKTSVKARNAYIEALIYGEPPVQVYAKTYNHEAGSYDEVASRSNRQSVMLCRLITKWNTPQ